MKRNAIAIIVSLVCSLLLFEQTGLAVSKKKSLEELTAEAHLILLGKVTSTYSFFDQDGSIRTDVTVNTDVVIGDGSRSGEDITIRVDGGEVGGVGMDVSDSPRFELNETVLLFLKKRVGYYEPIGRVQGKYTIGGDHVQETGAPVSDILEEIFSSLEKQKGASLKEQRVQAKRFIDIQRLQSGSMSTAALAGQCYTAPGYKWSAKSAAYTVGSDIPFNWISPIAGAASAWNQAGSLFRFTSGNNTNTITFRNFGTSSGTLALTTTWYNATTSEISRSITEFNSALLWSTTGESGKYDVQNIMTHEFGHWLNLGDIYDSGCSNVTMYGYASTGTTYQRSIEQPDRDGIIALYGRQLNWEFNSIGNFEGWSAINIAGSAGASVNSGILFMDPAGSDPYVVSPSLNANATTYRYVRLKMASNALDPYGNVYFKTQSENFYSADKRVEFSVRYCRLCGNAGFYDYVIYMGAHPKWTGTITGIRIDPANDGQAGTNVDSIGFDYIRLTP